MRAGWWSALALALACGSTSESEPQVGVRRAAYVFGADDRQELYELDAGWRDLAQRSIVGVLTSQRFTEDWSFCDGGPAAHLGPSVGQRLNLCDTERFASQPAVANCSGTLIDRDLVVTAEHCLGQGCDATFFATGLYYQAPGTLNDVARTDVYACRSVLISTHSDDVAIVQLDRPVSSAFGPAGVAPSPPSIGDPVGIIGFPSGLPMKASLHCVVKQIVGTDFRQNCDANAGNSGSGTFTIDGGVFAVLTTGPGDYRPIGPQGCSVNAQYDDDGKLVGLPTTPQLSGSRSILPSIAALCDAGWPSASLCGRAARCGDGVCSGGEQFLTCADCAPPRCGDAMCVPGEDVSCSTDCAARSEAQCPSPVSDAGDLAPVPPPPPPASCGCLSSDASVGSLLLLLLLSRSPRIRARAPSVLHQAFVDAV